MKNCNFGQGFFAVHVIAKELSNFLVIGTTTWYVSDYSVVILCRLNVHVYTNAMKA